MDLREHIVTNCLITSVVSKTCKAQILWILTLALLFFKTQE